MTPKTPEDYTDPTGSGEPTETHPTKDAPALTFEQYVRLEFKAMIQVQKDQGILLKSMHDRLMGLDRKELMNELTHSHANEFQTLHLGRELHARKIKQLEEDVERMRERLDAPENGH